MSLDELERSFIRAAQRELAPSSADRERNQAAVIGRLDGAAPWGGAAVSGLGLQGRSSAGTVRRAMASVRDSRLAMLGFGLIVGAAVGGWFGFGLGQSSGSALRADPAALASAPGTPASFSTQQMASGEASDPNAPHALAAAADASAPPSTLDPPLASPPVASELAGRNALRARASATRRAVVPSKPESSLARELAMLQRARRALNADNGRLALGIVQELDERFPNGVLIEERSATRVLSLCQLERVGEADQAAQAFLERYPASVYAERVRKGCAAPSRE